MRILLAALLAAATLSPQQAAIQQHVKDRAAARLAPNAIITERSSFWVIIPAAGSTPGANNTFFRSDLMISNHRPLPQLVDISFCPQNQTCTSGFQLKQVTVPGSSDVFFDDIVRQLGRSGLGTLDIRGRNADGSMDTSAKLDAFSRIWTTMGLSAGTPFEGGTTSQSFPSVRADTVRGTARAYILGLQHDVKYRTNIGVYNDDPTSAHTFVVRLLGADNLTTTSFTITVQPWSMNQVPVPAGNWGNFMAVVSPDANIGSSNWATWGSSTDNITGDGWVSIGSQND